MSRARRESQREEEARKRAWSRSRDSRAFGDGHGSVRVRYETSGRGRRDSRDEDRSVGAREDEDATEERTKLTPLVSRLLLAL